MTDADVPEVEWVGVRVCILTCMCFLRRTVTPPLALSSRAVVRNPVFNLGSQVSRPVGASGFSFVVCLVNLLTTDVSLHLIRVKFILIFVSVFAVTICISFLALSSTNFPQYYSSVRSLLVHT